MFDVTVITDVVTQLPIEAFNVYEPVEETLVVVLVGADPPGDQEYVVPDVDDDPLNATVEFVQVIVGVLDTERFGYGLIVTVNVFAGPVQPPKDGVAVITATCCEETVGDVYAEISPVPDVAIPTDEFVFVQFIVAPAGEGEKLTPETFPPEHTV